MALYTIKSRDEAMRPLMGYSGNNRFVLNQIAQMNGGATPQSTQIINALGRTTGAEGNGGGNFFEKRGRSIENAFGTTGAAVASAVKSGIGSMGGPEGAGTENIATQQLLKDTKQSMNDIAKKYGYNSWSDWQDAYQEAKDANDTAKVAEMKTQLKEFQAQANTNAAKADKKAAAYKDYTDNNYVSKKINQDRGKFAGAAINTLSTGVDLTGLSAGPVSNAVQGGIEGIADELEQNGLDNFSWQRAGQNAAIGAATGAVTGALNQGISNSLAKNGGNLFAGNNALSRGLNKVANIPGPQRLLGKYGGKVGQVAENAINTVGTGAIRGAVSGAVGGATGAGLQSAMNGVEFGQGVQNALQGAVQGAQQGAVTGGIMAGANAAFGKTNFGKQLQNAKTNWDQSGRNFDERLTKTLTSGDSAVGDWLMNKRQSRLLGTAGNLDNSIKDYTDQGMGIRKATDEAYRDLVRDAYDDERGGYEGALRDAKAAGYPNESNYQKAMRFLEGGSMDIYAEDMLNSLKDVYGDDFNESVYKNKDGSLKMRDGVPYVETMYKRQLAQRIAKDLDAMDANEYSPGSEKEGYVPGIADNYETAVAAKKARLDYLRNELDNERISYAELAELENYKPEILASGDTRLAEAAGIPEDEFMAYQAKQLNTPTTAKGWIKKAGQRIVEDINNSNLGNRVKDVSSETPQYDAWDRVAQEAGYNNYDEVIQRYMEANPNTPLNQRGAAGQILTWLDQNPNTPTTAGEWVKRAGQRAVEDINNSNLGMRVRDVSQDMPDDIRNMNIRDYNMYADGESAASEPQTYREALNRGVDNGLSGSELGDIAAPYSNLPNRVNGQELYNLMQNNPQLGSAVSYVASQVADSGETPTYNNMAQNYWDEVRAQYAQAQNYEGPGDYFDGTDEFTMARPTAETIQQTPMQKPIAIQNPQTEVFDSLTGKKTSAASKLRNAAGLKLQAQYGTIDKPTAKATNAPETLQKIANAGFTKPGDVERMADVITGSNGEVSKLVANLVETAKPINTFDGETDGQTMNDFIDLAIQKRGLDGIREGKAVKSQLNALMKSLPSHAEGSISFEDRPADVFKLTQLLDSEAANYEGRSGMNYGTTTPDKLRAAQVIKDVSNLYKNRIYDTVDVKQALTPEVAQNLKAYAPGNKAWADYIDNEIMTATSAKDLRSVQAPWVRAKKIIDNGYMNSVTYGGRNSGTIGNIPLTKRGVVGAVLGATVNSKLGLRAQAKALNKAADIVEGTQPNVNATVATPTELADMVSNYDQSTQLYNAIGRTEGAINRDEAARNIANIAQEAEIVPSMSYSAANINSIAPSMNNESTSVYNALTGTPTTNQMSYTPNTGYYQPTGDYWTDVIAGALTSAINDNDVEAFKTLYGMYQESLSNLNQNSNASSTSSLNATQQAQLAKLDAADSAIDELETLFENAGGGKGPIAGNLQSIAGNIGWDSGAKTYNDLSEGLVNQISAAIGKTDSLNTEGEVKRALKLIPQLTDDAQTAKNKLEELRRMLATTKSSYNAAYGLGY